MNCSICNFPLPDTAVTVRCVNCGGLTKPADSLTKPSPLENATSDVVYETPFGKFKAQFQQSKVWAISYRCTKANDHSEDAVRLFRNLTSACAEVSHPALPRFHRFEEPELRTIWSFHAVPELFPLARHPIPWATTSTARLVTQLVDILKRLHSAGLAIYDWSPSLLFATNNAETVVVFPSPWLATQIMWQPDKADRTQFVASELRERPTAANDPLRADIFGLGSLVWYLITGTPRYRSNMMLPSEHQSSLAPWDAFIDGCCRTNPARRFSSLEEVLGALPTNPNLTKSSNATSHLTPVLKHDGADNASKSFVPVAPPKFLTKRRVLCAIVALLLLIGYFRRDQFAKLIPGAGELFAPYERGFGDTILRYQDRSYDGSSWKPLKESKSLSAIASIGKDETFGALSAVSGWSNESFWILDSWGNAFQLRDGHWFSRGKLRKEGYLDLRLLDEDTALCAGSYGVRHQICKIAPQGVTEYGPLESVHFSAGFHSIAPVASDLFFFIGGFPDDRIYKVANGKLEILYPDRDKDVFVHRADNTPLKEYPVSGIQCIRGIESGRSLGIATRRYYSEYKIVEFRDGLWYVVTDISAKSVNDAWYYCERGVLKFAVVVGDKGHVLLHKIGSEAIDQSVNTAQETTSLRLIGVWGASADKYWVMDENGTVWEREGTLWRTVVRGLYRDNVKFKDVWISPTGTVFAVTDDVLYRLE